MLFPVVLAAVKSILGRGRELLCCLLRTSLPGMPGPFLSHSPRDARSLPISHSPRDARDPWSLPVSQPEECPGSPGCPVPSHLTARGIAAGAAPVPRAWPGCSSPGSNSGPAAAQGFKDRIRGSASAVQQEQPGFDVFRDRGRSTHSEELF